jgi:hypothetical protein
MPVNVVDNKDVAIADIQAIRKGIVEAKINAEVHWFIPTGSINDFVGGELYLAGPTGTLLSTKGEIDDALYRNYRPIVERLY